jgi:hypothetical protein
MKKLKRSLGFTGKMLMVLEGLKLMQQLKQETKEIASYNTPLR